MRYDAAASVELLGLRRRLTFHVTRARHIDAALPLRCLCSMELDKKVVISRTRLEETRGRIRGLVAELTDGGRTTERALKAAEHRLEVVTGRLDRMVSPAFALGRPAAAAPQEAVVES